MIPTRNSAYPMPGGGAKVAKVAPPAEMPAALPLGQVAQAPPPESDDPVGDAPSTGTAKLDPNASFTPPPRPKTAGRTVEGGIVQQVRSLLENALHPKVAFREDINTMRAEAEKLRTAAITEALGKLATLG